MAVTAPNTPEFTLEPGSWSLRLEVSAIRDGSDGTVLPLPCKYLTADEEPRANSTTYAAGASGGIAISGDWNGTSDLQGASFPYDGQPSSQDYAVASAQVLAPDGFVEALEGGLLEVVDVGFFFGFPSLDAIVLAKGGGGSGLEDGPYWLNPNYFGLYDQSLVSIPSGQNVYPFEAQEIYLETRGPAFWLSGHTNRMYPSNSAVSPLFGFTRSVDMDLAEQVTQLVDLLTAGNLALFFASVQNTGVEIDTAHFLIRYIVPEGPEPEPEFEIDGNLIASRRLFT